VKATSLPSLADARHKPVASRVGLLVRRQFPDSQAMKYKVKERGETIDV
jgi:hypothetical protein